VMSSHGSVDVMEYFFGLNSFKTLCTERTLEQKTLKNRPDARVCRSGCRRLPDNPNCQDRCQVAAQPDLRSLNVASTSKITLLT
jgi:hypothetical protein